MENIFGIIYNETDFLTKYLMTIPECQRNFRFYAMIFEFMQDKFHLASLAYKR